MCGEYICEVLPLGINRCSDGLLVYVNESLGKKVVANISSSGKSWCINTEVQCGGLIKVNWKPAEYLQKGDHVVTLGITDLKNNTISFPYGETCDDVCGIQFNINNDCSRGYRHINPDCGVPASYTWATSVYNCSWSETIYNCSWSRTTIQMIDKIKYGTTEYSIQSNPIVVTLGVAAINPAYEAELETIEAGAFMVDLIGDEVITTYIGTENVDMYDNCNLITKTCA